MVARFVKPRPSSSVSSHRFIRRTSSSCTTIKRILGKQHRMSVRQKRAPLTNKAGVVNRGSSPMIEDAAPSSVTTAAAHMPIPATGLRHPPTLPHTLGRPPLYEVDTSIIDEAFPHLKDHPPQYIRDKLVILGQHMFMAIRSVKAEVSRSTIPSEIEVQLNPSTEEARDNPPTHMIAVYPSSPSPGGKTQVTLYPSHQLIFNAYCAKLPAFPPPSTTPSTSENTLRLPVVSIRVPAPHVFPMLYHYLYTKSVDMFLAPLGLRHENDIESLSNVAKVIYCLWLNTRALGVVDRVLYDMLDRAWGRVITTFERLRS